MQVQNAEHQGAPLKRKTADNFFKSNKKSTISIVLFLYMLNTFILFIPIDYKMKHLILIFFEENIYIFQ